MYIPIGMRKAPKIEVDAAKCTTPLACRKCLEVCPQAIFHVETMKYERLRETDPKEPGSYGLDARWRYACTLCNACIDVCPVDAITIKIEEG